MSELTQKYGNLNEPTTFSVADLGGARGARVPPPLGAQILSISCSFRENLVKSYVGAPPGEILDPPLILYKDITNRV